MSNKSAKKEEEEEEEEEENSIKTKQNDKELGI